MTIHVLVLAAGSSSRMGEPKQLMKVGGETLLARTTRAALTASPYVTVVIGFQAGLHRKVLDQLAAHVVENTNWQKGMGSSLKEGLVSIRKSDPPADAVLIMLCDQPMVTPSHLQQLIARAGVSQKAIVASQYNNIVGVPAVFKKEMFGQLAMIADETGAARLLRERPADAEAIDFPGGAIDLDTPDDVKRFLEQHNANK